jgi:hypothetical protein
MKRIFIASPFAGNLWQRHLNRQYARKCLADALKRGEAPFAPHLLYPQCLDDNASQERALGMAAGNEWLFVAEACVVYVDRGITAGMMADIDAAESAGLQVGYRALDPNHQLEPIPGIDPVEPPQTIGRPPQALP